MLATTFSGSAVLGFRTHGFRFSLHQVYPFSEATSSIFAKENASSRQMYCRALRAECVILLALAQNVLLGQVPRTVG